MLQAADGVVLARSVEGTHARDPQHAATPFLVRETIAGVAPSGGFVLEQEAPLLRYAGLADAIVLVKRTASPSGSPRWLSVQPAGAGLVLDAPQLGEPTRGVLRDLFAAVHPAEGREPDVRRAVSALVRALSLPERKLRAVAVLDVAALATEPDHFTAAEVERLAGYGEAPGDDPQLAPQVREIGRLLAERQAGRPPAPEAGGEER
ncbi:MAG: hypothetical protein AB1689_06585 [Thermodesulfobacteriota bacterium]